MGKHGKRFVNKRKSRMKDKYSNKKPRLSMDKLQEDRSAPNKTGMERKTPGNHRDDIHLSSDSDEDGIQNAYKALVSSLGNSSQHKDYLTDDELSNSESESEENESFDEENESGIDAAEGDTDFIQDSEPEVQEVEVPSNSDESDESAESEQESSSEDAPEESDHKESSESEDDDGQNATNADLSTSDPFQLHFEHELDEKLATKLDDVSAWEKLELRIPLVGRCTCHKPKAISAPEQYFKETDLQKMHIKQMGGRVAGANERCAKVKLKNGESLTPLQQKFFAVINSYQDLYYADRTIENGEELRFVYSLHALNHIVKTRNQVISHNTKLKTKTAEPDEEFRDQGLTRPKVLIVVPFRESALRIVNTMVALLMADEEKNLLNRKRFLKEYGFDDEENYLNPEAKPEDYCATFARNTDDHFRIGIGVARKTLKLYSEFYKSDIIIASPLGLRTAIGAEGDKNRDFDFLSSIEVLILDQVDIFHMQNWDHVQHLLKHLHIQPKESHGVDFSRIRMWTLNGWSKFYLQTLMFSSFPTPAINSIFNKQCKNWAGKVQVLKSPPPGTIRQVVTQLPQVWHRINVSTHSELPNTRFQFFVDKILAKVKDESMRGVMIFIPSYFDFVRLRNYFKKESINFVFINEYTKDKSINRARGLFFHGRVKVLMYTERCHFYRRFRIRGIRHLVFYDLPLYSHFYSEICNLLQDPKRTAATDTGDENFTCIALYTKYDAQKLAGIVGNERAAQMLTADKSMHMLVTGES